ncbi:MAG: NYN domain-containing protein [Patescibacteria group bacterium]|jgi:uncharacterized LabA/DUF88 family protein
MEERVAVFIDGSNFYYKLKSLNVAHLLVFDYGRFTEWLARNRHIVARGYYVGVVRAKSDDDKAQKMRLNQRRLFNYLLQPSQGFYIKKGYLMKNDGIYHEKGVDVQLAIDIVIGAYDDVYDTAIIISSDTDLIPAMKKVKLLGKKIEYIGFAHQPSLAMQVHATLSRLILREDLDPYEFKGTII